MKLFKFLFPITCFITFFNSHSNAQANLLLDGVQWKSSQESINILTQAIQNEGGNTIVALTTLVPGKNFKYHFYTSLYDDLKKSGAELSIIALHSYTKACGTLSMPIDLTSDFAYSEITLIIDLLKK